MKQIWSIFFILLPLFGNCQCDFLSGTFFTDADIEEFIESNINCKTVYNINCVGSDIINLTLLSHFDTIQQLSIRANSRIKNLSFLDNIVISNSLSLEYLDSLNTLSKFYSEQPENFSLSSCTLIDSIQLTNSQYNSLNFYSDQLNIIVDKSIRVNVITLSHNVEIHTTNAVIARQSLFQSNPNYASFNSLSSDFKLDTLTTLQIVGLDYFSSEGFPDSMVCKSFSMGSIKNLNCDGFENKAAFF